MGRPWLTSPKSFLDYILPKGQRPACCLPFTLPDFQKQILRRRMKLKRMEPKMPPIIDDLFFCVLGGNAEDGNGGTKTKKQTF